VFDSVLLLQNGDKVLLQDGLSELKLNGQ
jgi:hypothetical protein